MRRTMKFISLLAMTTLASTGLSACGDDDSGATIDAAATADSAAGTIDAGGTPTEPSLGAQIDRMGRPAINTALNEPFDLNTPSTHDANKNAYNTNDDPSTWATAFQAELKFNLAILDGLNATDDNMAFEACGDQLLAGTGATAYDTLSSVLVNDRLWVNSASSTCADFYLAVEANAVGAAVNTDCGGRTLDADVIDVSYSVLAAGLLDQSIGDNIDANDVTNSATFPYLAAPQ